MNPNFVEYLVVGLYFAFMIITGLAFRRYNRNFADYFRSGCRGTWWLVGGSVFMASFTAWTFTGAAGVAYDAGLPVAVIFFANAIGYTVNAVVTAPWFRQMRATTGPEVIRERFDTVTQQFLVWYGIVPGILTASLTLWGVALFSSSVFGFDVKTLVIVLGLVVLIYSTIGGSWSVMATDFLQALILLPMTVLVAWLSLRLAGGFEGLVASLKAQDLERMLSVVDTRPGAQCNSWWAIAMFAFVMVSYNSVTASVKYFTCKDGREARRAAALAAVLMFVGAFLWFVPPIVARLHFAEALEALKAANPEIKNVAETSYALVAMKLLPAGMTGMIVVAMFAATMSSLSPSLNQTAAVFTQDVYKQLFRPWAKDREVFVFGQVISVVVGLLIIASALYFASFGSQKGLFHYMLKLGSIFGTPTVVPMFLALFLRRTPPWSALAAIIGAAPVSIYSLVYEVRYEWTVLGILAAGTVTFLLTTLFWASVPEASKRRIEGFYERMHRPVDFEAEVGRPNDPGQLKLVGYVSLAVGLFMMLILAVPNPLEGRIQIACVAGSIVVFATAMILTGYRKERLETARLAVPAIEPLSGADGEPPA